MITNSLSQQSHTPDMLLNLGKLLCNFAEEKQEVREKVCK